MTKKIRVKKTDTFDKRDMTLLSDRETSALDGGYMVNLPEIVAREMIDKGWVINIDPLKPIQTERKIIESQTINPGMEVADDTGTTEDVPPAGTDGEIQSESGTGDLDEGGEADNGSKEPVNPGLD